MNTRIRATAVLGLPAVVACCLLPCATAEATESAAAPLPASNYTVRPVCAAPAPGHAGCLALRLVPVTAAARAHTHPLGMTRSAPTRAGRAVEICESPTAAEGCYGLRPRDLLSAYNLPLPPQPASTQTIAILDAYNDLGAEPDLEAYDNEFGLPPCTETNKCFKKVNQKGETGNLPFPESEASRVTKEAVCKTGIEPIAGEACKGVEEADGWAGEISLDIEVAHAICQNCHIVLVEANSATFPDLEAAEEIAAKPKIEKGIGATEISDSWGGPECSEGLSGLECFPDSSAFNHPGIVITVASGDNGYLDWAAKEPSERGFADYPASSPHVVAVGGTRLLQSHGAWAGETVWNDGGQNTTGEIEGAGAGGSGCSTSLLAPSWQLSVPDWESVGCGVHRAVADISADADPYTGAAIYDSTPERMGGGTPGWITIGGTSLASPIIAATFALAGGAGKNAGGETVKYPAQTLYENLAASSQSLHDVELGSNGKCSKPFNEVTGISGCSELQEAAQCSGKAICLAQKGYDGPSGVGTPNGIAAFQPLTEEAKRNFEERKAKEKQVEEQKRKEKIEEEGRRSPSEGTTGVLPNPNNTTGGALTTATAPLTGFVKSPIVPLISGLALTRTALLALNRARPEVSAVGFAFTLSAATRVRATLAKRIRVRGRNRWELVPGALTFTAAKGRNRRHLTNRHALTPGRYRLTLTPAHGRPRSLIFVIG
ncbi:MAG TPA: S53 family peptidase [Solirubrobacteraceae bacterium]